MVGVAITIVALTCTAEGQTQMIDELKALDLNGARQWILCRGSDRSMPVVLFVHGGPGNPSMWYSRAFDNDFINDFVVVHWDQRGAGKSYSKETPRETINLNQIVDDGLELTARLKQKFETDKVILVGHSWGTMVAANSSCSLFVTKDKSVRSVEEGRFSDDRLRLGVQGGNLSWELVAQEGLAAATTSTFRTN